MANKTSKKVEIREEPLPKYTRLKEKLKAFALFAIPGVLLGLLILINKEALIKIRQTIIAENIFFIVLHTFLGLGISAQIGALQIIILRRNLKSRYYLFVLIAGIGGLFGGLCVGFLVQYHVVDNGYLAGYILGFISGGISSFVQNMLMSKGRKTYKWFIFSITLWPILFSIAWGIAWFRQIEGIAFGTVFILITMGLSLLIFLKMNSDIEFG